MKKTTPQLSFSCILTHSTTHTEIGDVHMVNTDWNFVGFERSRPLPGGLSSESSSSED